MTSNPIRFSFSLKDKEGKQYPDILTGFLLPQYLTSHDYDIGTLTNNGQTFSLHCTHDVRKELGLYGYASCLISYQVRTNGCYAIARLLQNKGE